MTVFLKGFIASKGRLVGRIARQRRDEIRTADGVEGDETICVRRTGITVARWEEMTSGDSMTITYSVSMAFPRNTGDGKLSDCNNNGNNEGNSGSRISFGILPIMFDNAIK